MNTTLYFPIGFNTTLTIIGVGFVISDIGRQDCRFTSTALETLSDSGYHIAATNSYLAIGI